MILKFIYWLSRILAILAILFIFMFSFDVFDGGGIRGYKLMAFIMHNIPAFLFIIALAVAWKYEIAGGSIFIFFSIVLAFYFNVFTGNPGALAVISPFFISGILFIVHQVLEKDRKEKSER